jgi:hypothetical protein
MGRKCKHSATHRLWWWAGIWITWTEAVRRDIPWDDYGARRCGDCGTWLPLGESDETDPRVAVEIEAARLAAHLHFDDFPEDEPEDEWADYGWAAHTSGCDVYEGTWHGWLAAVIATHTDGDQ